MSAATVAPTHEPRRPASAPAGGTRPDPQRLAALLTRTWLEVRSGRRPLAQLAPLLTPALHRRLASQIPRPPLAGGGMVRVRRTVVSQPAEGACEASVVVEQGGRVTAFAVRLERYHGAWRVVELTAPELGLRPLSTAPPHRDTD